MSILVAKVNGPNKGWNDDEFTTIEEDFMKSDGIGDDSGTGQDLEVVEDAPASLNVIVDEGVCYVRTTRSGRSWYIRVKVDSAETVAIAQNLSGNDRIDALIVRVSASVIPDATASNVATLEIVEGAPAVGPSAPSDGDIQTAIGSDAFYRIADVEVDNGVGQIFDADIDDQRAGLNFGFNNSPIYTTFYGNGNNLDGVVHSPVDEHLLADGNGTRNLGATGTRWKDLWLSGDITATGDVVANSFAGDGSGITGIVSNRDYGSGSDGAMSVSLGSEETKDSVLTGANAVSLYTSASNQGCAWSYTASSSYLATKIKIWLEKTGAPGGTLTATLFRVNKTVTSGTGYGLGPFAEGADLWGIKLAAATLSITTVSSSFAEYELTWDADAHIVDGEQYVIEIAANGSGTDYLKIYNSSDGTGEYWWARTTTQWHEQEQAGYFEMVGRSNAVELNTYKVYEYSSISVDAKCQIIPMRAAFQNKPCIIKCAGACDLEDAYLNAVALGCDDVTVAPFGGTTDGNSKNGNTDVGKLIGNIGLLYSVFCGGKGYTDGLGGIYETGTGGDGGGAVVLAVRGNINLTNFIMDTSGEPAWHSLHLYNDAAFGGAGGGGGGTAIIFYAGVLTGTVDFVVNGGLGGQGGYDTFETGRAGAAGGGGMTDGFEGDPQQATHHGGIGGAGGVGGGAISKYF